MDRFCSFSLILNLYIFFLFVVSPNAASHLNVTISNGIITGQQFSISAQNGWEFLAIPFAQPPVGNLRFAKPQPYTTKWTTPLMATKPPNRCPQQAIDFGQRFPKSMIGAINENCLTLNVWMPENATSSSKSVMVWIHGGGYQIGDGYPSYSGRALSILGDVVVVTIHYRLGVFGFLRLGESVSGNWGLWDQQLALKWVSENIANFGGNPSSITVFGESAGASSISLQLLNTQSNQYYQRAILESGNPIAMWAFNPNTQDFTDNSMLFAKHAGCGNGGVGGMVACLRKKTVSQLMAFAGTFTDTNALRLDFLPVLDGDFVKESPIKTYMSGKMAKKDLLMGVNEDEGGMLILLMMNSLSSVFKTRATSMGVPPAYPKFLKYLFSYFPHSYGKLLAPQLISFIQANQMADAYAKIKSSVYFYMFKHRPSFSQFPSYIGASHTDEMPYVFAWDLLFPKSYNFTAGDTSVSRQMIGDWSTFAKTGKPKSSDWKAYDSKSKSYYQLAVNSSLQQNGFETKPCTFWTKIFPTMIEEVKKSKPTPVMPVCGQFNDTVKVLVAVLVVLVIIDICCIVYCCYRRSKLNSKKHMIS